MIDPLAALRDRFVERCRDDLERLEAGAPGDADIDMRVHKLAGAAGSFGFADLSEAAAVVDLARVEGDAPPPAAYDALIRALRAVAGA